MESYDEDRKKAWEDLDVTHDELHQLTECMKQPDFRDLLREYAEEVSNPENRRIFETEMIQLERERGVEATFVHPEPGYVIKTSLDGRTKCFINVCQNELAGRPTSKMSRSEDQQQQPGLTWSIPHIIASPRDELDQKKVRCRVFDVVYHPDTLYLAQRNPAFKGILNDTAVDAVENNFKVKLDRKNIRFPKMNYMGVSQPTVLRKPCEKPATEKLDIEPEIYQKLMSSYDEARERHSKKREEKPKRDSPKARYFNSKDKTKAAKNNDSKYTTPKFIVKHQTYLDLDEFRESKDAKMHATVPKKLVIDINLPLLRSAGDATLDVQERHLSLKSETPAKYNLELPLSYRVDPDKGSAKFDAKSKRLTVTLPVVPAGASIPADGREDSGVESDHGSPVPESQITDNQLVREISIDLQKNEVSNDSQKQETLGGSQQKDISNDSQKNEMSNHSQQIKILSDPQKKEILSESQKNEISSGSQLNEMSDLEQSKNWSDLLQSENSSSKVQSYCVETALRTNDDEKLSAPFFVNPNVKYILPAFTCNVYDNMLAVTIHAKNVDSESIRHRILENEAGLHVLLTSIGAGYFPVYYSLCFKLGNDAVVSESLTVEPWDNNVVLSFKVRRVDELARYFVGIDEDSLEAKDLTAAASIKNQLLALEDPEPAIDKKNIEVVRSGNDIIVNVKVTKGSDDARSAYTNDGDDGDDENDRESAPQKEVEERKRSFGKQSRSISESSGDELPSSIGSGNGSIRYKSILKPRHFSRSVSESSLDWNSSAVTFNDSVNELTSEFEGSSLKKTVRFNDVVSRQLYRSNSSILGQRKKNQRKLRNKKRAHERRMSESENSETDEREKYKVEAITKEPERDTSSAARPILHCQPSCVSTETNCVSAAIEIERRSNKRKQKRNSSANNNGLDDKAKTEIHSDEESSTDMKNDLMFDLEV